MLIYLKLRAGITLGLILAFLLNNSGPIAQAQEFVLPLPGKMVALSPAFNPPVLKGIKLDPKNPFRFHFFVDSGDHVTQNMSSPQAQEQLRKESARLIKYFLASLTIPEKDLWVNLSPYEKDRIVPMEFGQTEMGRDLLAEDYLLKQITASLIYPESQLGHEFWHKVYAQAAAKYGTTNIPINTFNKVWIVPEKAVVYENGGTAYVLENHLKVMLEQDYLSLQKHSNVLSENNMNALGSQIVHEIVIPALTKEINEGRNFAQLRQVFYSLILATWYKKKVKDSIFNKVYSNSNKIEGVQYDQRLITGEGASSKRTINDVAMIYQQYLRAFKKGVYNYIKEDPDPVTREVIPRKYFSGGVVGSAIPKVLVIEGPGQVSSTQFADLAQASPVVDIDGNMKFNDKAMNTDPLIENLAMKHFVSLGPAYEKIVEMSIKPFLDYESNNHEIKEKIFSEINGMDDERIISSMNEILRLPHDKTKDLHLYRNWTIRELFLSPTKGIEDISQALTGIEYVSESREYEFLLGDEKLGQFIKGLYLLVKSIGIISKEADLFRPEDSQAESWYFQYLLSKDILPLRGSEKIVPLETVRNQLSFSTLLIGQLLGHDVIGHEDEVTIEQLAEAMTRPDKQKNLVSIKSYLTLLERLKTTRSESQLESESPAWKEGIIRLLQSNDAGTQRYQRNIDKLQSALEVVKRTDGAMIGRLEPNNDITEFIDPNLDTKPITAARLELNSAASGLMNGLPVGSMWREYWMNTANIPVREATRYPGDKNNGGVIQSPYQMNYLLKQYSSREGILNLIFKAIMTQGFTKNDYKKYLNIAHRSQMIDKEMKNVYIGTSRNSEMKEEEAGPAKIIIDDILNGKYDITQKYADYTLAQSFDAFLSYFDLPPNAPRETIVARIADYYYFTMLQTDYLPFGPQGVNNAFIMNIVNTMFRLKGYNGISHGKLDSMSSRNWDGFHKAFLEAFEATNPISEAKIADGAMTARVNRRKAIKMIAGGIGVATATIMGGGILRPEHQGPAGKVSLLSKAFDPTKPTLLFIHGGNDDNPNGTVKDIKELSEGYYNVFMFRYDYLNSFPSLRDDLIKEIQEIKRKYNLTNMTVISYSYGAVIFRGAVLRDDKGLFSNASVIQLVPVGGGVTDFKYLPNSWILKWNLLAKQYHQLAEALNPNDNQIQEDLFGKQGDEKFNAKIRRPYYTLLSSTDDEKMADASSQEVRAQYQRGIGSNTIMIPGSTHEELPNLPQTLKELKKILRIPDGAMTSTGGIDFNPSQMTMEVKKEGEDFKFDFNGREINAAQVTGATFIIHLMTPVTNLPQMLGLNLEPSREPNRSQEFLVRT